MSRNNGNNHSVDLDIGTLSGHLWEAANILRGPVDAADFKTYIFPLLFFKRLSDVYDEEYAVALEESDGDVEFAQFPENHRFQVPEGCHGKDVRAKSFLTGGRHIQCHVAGSHSFGDEENFACVIGNEEFREENINLGIPVHIRADNGNSNGNGAAETVSLKQATANW